VYFSYLCALKFSESDREKAEERIRQSGHQIMDNSFIRHKTGLDRKEAENALTEFLKPENEAKVFAVKGDWGVGKTYLVRTFLQHIKKSYHYGSIFGISTIDELKTQLWINLCSDNETHGKSRKSKIRALFQNANRNSKDLGNLVEVIPKMGEYGIGFTPAIINLASNFIVNNSLQDKLICIDDLERRSESLSLNKILGFIESLSEGKNCKIIIIYNEDKIKEHQESNSTLAEYKEKVIDFEIKLEPNTIDNFHIGFGESDPDENIVLNYFDRAEVRINNIRVLKKLKLNLEKIRPHINIFLPEVRHKIINEAIFISLSKLDTSFPINVDKLISLGSFQEILKLSNHEKEQELYFKANMLGYTFSGISDEIIRLVETSVCNYKIIHEEGKKLNDREVNHKIGEKLHEAYRPYSESFESSEAELHDNLKNFLEHYYKSLSFRDLQGLTDISKAINLDIKIYWEKWIKYQIDKSETLENLYYLQSIIQASNVFAVNNIRSSLEEKISTFEQDLSIDAILMKALDKQGWSNQDSDYLNRRTLEQWKQWILERHPEKSSMVRQGLKMQGEFSQNLEKAIVDLAQVSALNRMRAEKLYDLVIEDSNASDN
jgi:KAP family P-loop domain